MLKGKVYAFVEQILLMLKDHPLDKRDIVTIELIKQLVRSSASIGANLSEAEVAISDKEFGRIL